MSARIGQVLQVVGLSILCCGLPANRLQAKQIETSNVDDREQAESVEKPGIGLLEPTVERWEMGLELTGGAGRATGITAMAPLPVDWPEQAITILDEEKSGNVARIRMEELDGAVRQMLVTVPSLSAGEVAKVVITLEVRKNWILAPQGTEQFQLASNVDRKIRKYLGPSPFIESRDRRIVQLAEQLADEVEGRPAWQQVEYFYDWVREHVEYRFDERIKPCVDALEDGVGDCEELSSLFIAICRANGIPARAVWIPGHTYPEFYLVDQDGQGHWFPCQAAGAREFGAMSEDRPILQKGDRFRIHGHRDAMRYVQPTLTARDATASPSVRWILNRVEEQ